MTFGTHQVEYVYKVLPEGTYVGKFTKFWREKGSKDTDRPKIFSNYFTHEPQFRYNLEVTEDGENKGLAAPGSMDLSELMKFAFALGISPQEYKALTSDISDEGTLLYVVERALVGAGKTAKFVVLPGKEGKQGWVDKVYGAEIPDGSYTFTFDGFTTRKTVGEGDNKVSLPTWIEKEYKGQKSKVAYGRVTIADGPYKGLNARLELPYIMVLINDVVSFPETVKVKDGKKEANRSDRSKRAEKFLLAIGADKATTFANENNLLPEMEVAAKATKRFIMGDIEKGFVKSMLYVEGMTITEQKKEVIEASPHAHLLYDYLEARIKAEEGDDVVVFENNGDWSEVALKWLTDNFKPVAKELGVPTKVNKLSTGEIVRVLERFGENDLAQEILSAEQSDDDF